MPDIRRHHKGNAGVHSAVSVTPEAIMEMLVTMLLICVIIIRRNNASCRL